MKTLDEKINEQIKQCNEVLERNDFAEINKLAKYLYSLYRLEISSINSIGYNKYKSEFGEIELEKIKDSLELYLAKEMLELEKEKYRGANVSLSSSSDSSIKDSFKATDSFNSTNTNTNTNTVTLDLKTMFDNARKIIEEDEALGEEEVEEIISRINEIEEIGNENIPRPQKWRKLKACVNWISTKGVKVAIQVMPLITEILKMQNG